MNTFRAYKLKLPNSEVEESDNNRAAIYPEHRTRKYAEGRVGAPSLPAYNIQKNLIADWYRSASLLNVNAARTDGLLHSNFPSILSFFPRPSTTYKNTYEFTRAAQKAGTPPGNHLTEPNAKFFAEVPPLIFLHPNHRGDSLPEMFYKANIKPDAPLYNCRQAYGLTHDRFHTKPIHKGVKSYGTAPSSVLDKSNSATSSQVPSTSSASQGSNETTVRRNDLDSNVNLDEAERKEGCYRCSYCNRTFSYYCHMKVHERVHTGEKPYKCKYCQHPFSQLGSLTVHMRIHTGAKPYRCGNCTKNFRHVNSLRRHQRQVHNMSGDQIAESGGKIKDEKLPTRRFHGQVNSTANVKLKPRRTKFSLGVFETLPSSKIGFGGGSNAIPPVFGWDKLLRQNTLLTNKSKFITELEHREKEKSNGMHRQLTPTRSITKSPTNKSFRKINESQKSTKTWRPFDDDSDTAFKRKFSQVPSKGKSVSSHWARSSLMPYTERSMKNREVGTSRKNVGVPKTFSETFGTNVISPLKVIYKKSNRRNGNAPLVKKEKKEDFQFFESPAKDMSSPIVKPRSQGRTESETNSSDEGFSSSGSTGNAGSPHLPLDATEPDEIISDQIIEKAQLESEGNNDTGKNRPKF